MKQKKKVPSYSRGLRPLNIGILWCGYRDAMPNLFPSSHNSFTAIAISHYGQEDLPNQ